MAGQDLKASQCTATSKTTGNRCTRPAILDPVWPKPLPEAWITGQLGGVRTDSHDHIVVVNRRDIIAEEAETSQQAPPIIMFDLAANVVASWGDPNVVPHSIHGCAFDAENHVWVGGNDDGIIQKYSHEGRLLAQIGTSGLFDSSDGTSKGKSQNASHERFFNPAGIAIDSSNGDLYVADGYGNRRVVVLDKDGSSFANGGGRPPMTRREQGPEACSRESCTAS